MITTEGEGTVEVNKEDPVVLWEGDDDCNPWGTITEDTTSGTNLTDLSIHTITGTQGIHTLRLQGNMKGKKVSILIDSGSSHSFISQSLVKHLKLHTNSCNEVDVTVANGEKLKCSQVADGVKWNMSGEQFYYTFNILPIRGYDIILRVNWMKVVSPVVFDFDHGVIAVKWKGKRIELSNNSSVDYVEKIVTTSDVKAYSSEDACFLCQVVAVEEETTTTNITPSSITALLQQYPDLFEEPKGLPPPRAHDHLIPLKDGSVPVSSNPYRCPYVQKNEIEKIVKEMLASGIVRHSTSPFASPVLLVRKKDLSWRLCVDYRALNSMTVKNKYLIPIIEELLAELRGSSMYSKLDLRSGYHQIRVHPDDIQKTAFKTHDGHYEFMVVRSKVS
ncbi:hypothetical protein DCAR_0624517 [Daucus carota subsp. sativus]|uniref:Reverse transcriptase domain-containing protein n=1 Tax=Daucus carota subsp. sativus TaxID=79200 RepID=A0AAF1B3B8_DAUCS|nr:hypothetical protein DCAR_0624517 [Daucus carota subsp. sativus]